jgi:hypothetical protein
MIHRDFPNEGFSFNKVIGMYRFSTLLPEAEVARPWPKTVTKLI